MPLSLRDTAHLRLSMPFLQTTESLGEIRWVPDVEETW